MRVNNDNIIRALLPIDDKLAYEQEADTHAAGQLNLMIMSSTLLLGP
jgi:hypothetical protein